jgi:hypothetical protein
VIESEDDVRAYVREASLGRARWVEPALGSTPGLPDCWVPLPVERWRNIKTVQVHLELKAGVITEGYLRYELRPEQRREIRVMLADKLSVGLLIGIKGTQTVVFALPTEKALSGRIALEGDHFYKKCKPIAVSGTKEGFWAGVNFIFSEKQ